MHKLRFSHTLTRIFTVRCDCGFLATAGNPKARDRKGDEHLKAVG